MAPKPHSSSSAKGGKSPAPPREAWMQHLTHSGYLKVEVYADLKKCLLEKDHTRLCYRVAELACTKGELPNLYDALIEAHAKYFLSSNTWVLDRVLAIVGILKALPKKNLIQNIAFQKHICEWALLLSVQHVKVASTFGFDIRPLPVGDQASMAAEHARIESLASNPVHPVPSSSRVAGMVAGSGGANRLHDALYNRVSHDIYKRFTALYKALQDQCFKDVQSIVRFLLCTKEHFVDEITYDAIETVKRTLRKDMVWYVWRVLCIFSQDCVEIPLLNAYVMRALAMYAFQYKKKHRLTRIPFLMYACWIACHVQGKGEGNSSKLRLRHQETSYPLQEAVQNVHIVFAEILGLQEKDPGEDEWLEEDASDDRDSLEDGYSIGTDTGTDKSKGGRDTNTKKKPLPARKGRENDLPTYAAPLPAPVAPRSNSQLPSKQSVSSVAKPLRQRQTGRKKAAAATEPAALSEDLRYLKVCTYYDPQHDSDDVS